MNYKHHPKCPTYPGKVLNPGEICADCVYGRLNKRKRGLPKKYFKVMEAIKKAGL